MLRDILIHMDRGAGCTARLMAAIDLAHRHGARLKGLYVMAHPHYASSSDYMSDYAQVREFFVNATSKAGVNGEWLTVDWGVVGTPLQTIVTRYAYFADLVLIGQPVYMKNRKSSLEFHEQILLSCGRPVIVFPSSGQIFRFGNNILVAWKGGRESVRMIHDALPLLKAAKSVSFVSFVRERNEQSVENASMLQLLEHLELHGVKAEAETVLLERITIFDALHEYANKKQPDLIALGAFSYKSNRAPFLSLLAVELLVRSELPLLLSH